MVTEGDIIVVQIIKCLYYRLRGDIIVINEIVKNVRDTYIALQT